MASNNEWEYNEAYPDEDPVDITESTTPRILMMGTRRSGKSSMSGVVFHKMPPHETMFMEATGLLDIKYVANNAFVQFQIWDFPGDFDFDRNELMYGDTVVNPQVAFSACGALVFVVDAQDEPYQDSLLQLVKTIQIAHKVNPNISFEVFIHKVDGDLFLTDEQKIDCQHEIQQTVLDELAEIGLDFVHVSFYLTSIYDHTVFEAFSKVVQKLMSQQQYSTLENLLNDLISHSHMEKSFLFDVVSKIYIATDSNPVDMQSYELCADMIDVVIDVSCIYGLPKNQLGAASESSKKELSDGSGGDVASTNAPTETTDSNQPIETTDATVGGDEKLGENKVSNTDADRSNSVSTLNERTAWPSVDLADGTTLPTLVDSDQSLNDKTEGAPIDGKVLKTDLKMNDLGHDLNLPVDGQGNHANQGSGWAFDSNSSSVIKLSNGMVLFLREVNSYLALVCILRADTMMKKGLIDYNIDCFKKGLSDVFLGHNPSSAMEEEAGE